MNNYSNNFDTKNANTNLYDDNPNSDYFNFERAEADLMRGSYLLMDPQFNEELHQEFNHHHSPKILNSDDSIKDWEEHILMPVHHFNIENDLGLGLGWGELCRINPNKAFKILENLMAKGIFKCARYEVLFDHWAGIQIFGRCSDEFKRKSNDEKMECVNALRIIINNREGIIKLSELINNVLIAIEDEIKHIEQEDIFLEFFDNAMKSNNNITDPEMNPFVLATELLCKYQMIKDVSVDFNFGIHPDIKERLELILEKPDQISLMGITSNLHFWRKYDENWAQDKIYPLFYWDKDRNIARIAWNGYLSSGGYQEYYGIIYDYVLDNAEGVMSLDQKYIDSYSRVLGFYMGRSDITMNKKLKNCYRIIGDKNRLFALEYMSEFISNISYDNEKTWNKITKLFFKNYWDKDFKSTKGMRVHFETILIASQKKFTKSYGYIYDILVKDNNKINISPVVNGLLNDNEVGYLTKYPLESFKLLSISVHDDTEMTSGQIITMNNFLHEITDKKILGLSEYKKLKEKIR